MPKGQITVKKLNNTRVIGGKKFLRPIGRVQEVVFHPTEQRIVGVVMRKPDILFMFKRKDRFISVEGFQIIDEKIYKSGNSKTLDKAGFKAMGLEADDCVLWIGLPILSKDGAGFGFVVDVAIDIETGEVCSVEAGAGALDNLVLGKLTIPRKMIKGFKKGIGVALALAEGDEAFRQTDVLGTLLVSNKVSEIVVEEGLAQKAGKKTAVVADKAGKAHAVVSKKASAAAIVAGTMVTDGAVATGKQIRKTKGMFSSFKDEYKKARHGEKPD